LEARVGNGICKQVEIIFMCGEKGANKRGSPRKGLAKARVTKAAPEARTCN